MKKQNIISWIALTLSIIACIITLIRVDVTVANDSFISMIAGFMGVCATLLVGSQIYNSIETSRRIKELDDNNRKPICRMYFNTATKYVATIDENKKDIKHAIEGLDDLFQYTEDYFKAIDMYETKE